jgi:hypothetical protein
MPQSQLAPSLQSPSRQPRRRGFSNLRRHHPSWIQAMRTGCPVPTSRQPGRVAGDSGKPHSHEGLSRRDGSVPGLHDPCQTGWEARPVSLAQRSLPARHATTVQIMVTNSKRYASTRGWGSAASSKASQWTKRSSCHEAHARDHDFVFTHYVL